MIYFMTQSEERMHREENMTKAKYSTEEIVPLERQNHATTKFKSRLEKVRNDDKYRIKIIYTVAMTWAYFAQGWVKGQIGPSLPDMQYITRTNLEQSSAFVTSFFVGKIVGCSSGGLIIDRFQINWSMALLYFINSITTAVTPWASNYIATLGIFFVIGFTNGALDVAQVTSAISLFTKNKDTYIHITQLTLSVSSILSPLAVAPFTMSTKSLLKQQENDNTHLNYNVTFTNISGGPVTGIDSNKHILTNITETYDRRMESNIFIPFSIASAMMLFSALIFAVLKISGNEFPPIARKVFKKPKQKSKKDIKSILCLINACLLLTYASALEVAMGNMLSVFFLKFLGWQPEKGAFAISLFFFAYMIGRIFGIFLSRCLKPIYILGIYTLICMLSFGAFLGCSYLLSNLGFLMSCSFCGFGISVIFPSGMTWLCQTLGRVSGKMTSFILTVCFIGSMCMSPILSVMMEQVADIAFSYVCVVTCMLMLFSYICLIILGRKPQTYEKETIIKI